MTRSTCSDQELIQLYLQGDERSFQQLLSRHHHIIFGRIFNLVRDENVAADMYQETLFKAIRTLKRGGYNDEGKFLPWILRIAQNLVFDHFRNGQKVRFLRATDEYDPFERIDLKDDGAAESHEREHNLEMLERYLSHLPDEQREVVVLRMYYDLSFREIAERCGLNINTALGRMRYALIRLKKIAEDANTRSDVLK